MTQSEAQKYLPLIKAFSEGKIIQYFHGGNWIDRDNLTFDGNIKDYRIKPEPKTVPLTIEDLYEHFKKGTIFVNINDRDFFTKICAILRGKIDYIYVGSWASLATIEFLKKYTFEDGSPLVKTIEE